MKREGGSLAVVSGEHILPVTSLGHSPFPMPACDETGGCCLHPNDSSADGEAEESSIVTDSRHSQKVDGRRAPRSHIRQSWRSLPALARPVAARVMPDWWPYDGGLRYKTPTPSGHHRAATGVGGGFGRRLYLSGT